MSHSIQSIDAMQLVQRYHWAGQQSPVLTDAWLRGTARRHTIAQSAAPGLQSPFHPVVLRPRGTWLTQSPSLCLPWPGAKAFFAPAIFAREIKTGEGWGLQWRQRRGGDDDDEGLMHFSLAAYRNDDVADIAHRPTERGHPRRRALLACVWQYVNIHTTSSEDARG